MPRLFAQETGECAVAHTPYTVGGRLALLIMRATLVCASTAVALRGVSRHRASRRYVAQLVALSTLSEYRGVSGSNKLNANSKHPDSFGPC
jgi:hypothetical protein